MGCVAKTHVLQYFGCARPVEAQPNYLVSSFRVVAPGSWHLWYPDLSFGMLCAFTLTSWGNLGRSWDIGDHKKGPFEVQAWILIDF